METKENKPKTGKLKKTATVSALALLTAASVTTGSLFSTPAALLSNDAPASAYTVTVDLDGADDDAGAEQDESDETRKRGGVRATLRARILRLPLAVRLLAVLPLWALGSAILAAAGAAWTLLAPALGKVAGWALMLALLAGSFLLAAKAAFPDLPVKKLLNRRSLVALALGASALAVADAVFAAAWEDYAQIKDVVLSAGFFVVLSCAAVPFALREQKRRLAAAAAEPPKKPDKLVFTDGLDTYTVRVPDLGV